VLNLIGDRLRPTDTNASAFSKSEALSVLGELIDKFPSFSEREKALYLRAIVFSSLGREDDAHKAWQHLATGAGRSIFTVRAHIAVGDYWFDREDAARALKAYQDGLKLLGAIEIDQKDYELVRLNY